MAFPAATRSIANFADITHHIFAHLNPEHHSSYDTKASIYDARQALANAARSCRAFTRPALKILWRSLPDDQPLADLLCTLGIAQREGVLDGSYDGEIGEKPARFELPLQLGNYWALPGEREAVERRWKKLRGYDDHYVKRSFYNAAKSH